MVFWVKIICCLQNSPCSTSFRTGKGRPRKLWHFRPPPPPTACRAVPGSKQPWRKVTPQRTTARGLLSHYAPAPQGQARCPHTLQTVVKIEGRAFVCPRVSKGRKLLRMPQWETGQERPDVGQHSRRWPGDGGDGSTGLGASNGFCKKPG